MLAELLSSVAELRSGEELDALLRRVVDAARELVGARYAALGVLGSSDGDLADFIHMGVHASIAAEIGELPRGRGLLGGLLVDHRPRRVANIETAADSVGFPPGHPPMRRFLGMPIRVGHDLFGSLYLADRVDAATSSTASRSLTAPGQSPVGMSLATTSTPPCSPHSHATPSAPPP